MSLFAFILATVSLLATPGPTNTLLATAGAECGVRRSLPLLVAELSAYLLAISLFRVVLRPLAVANPVFGIALQGAIVVYLVYLATVLWRRGAGRIATGRTITFSHIFITTAMNPKAIIFAFTILPAKVDFAALIPWLAALSIQIMLIGLGWIAIGHSLRRNLQDPGRSRIGYRAGAVVLGVMAGLIAARSFAS